MLIVWKLGMGLEHLWEFSVLSAQFLCKPKTSHKNSLKNSLQTINNNKKNLDG